MEIEVGMYIKTNLGEIAKIIKSGYFENKAGKFRTLTPDKVIKLVDCDAQKNIAKVSHDIIDLIEAGDCVNGYKVIATYLKGANKYIKLEGNNGKRIYNKDIKFVVTKEQFENMKYKVGEDND